MPYSVVSMGQELVHDSTSIGAVALAILKREGTRYLALNGEVVETFGSEPVHQMRVTTRRIQVAMKCLGDFLPKRFNKLDRALKPGFRALGSVRDLDMDIEQLVSSCPESHARGVLVETLECERKMATEVLAIELASDRHSELVKVLKEINHLSIGALPKRAQENAVAVAPKVIRKKYRKLEKGARRVDAASSQDKIHDFRKQSKGVRYLLEFFVDVYGKPAKKIIRELKTLQDDLGTFVDAKVALQTMERLRTSWPLDDGSRELVKDLIEMYGLRARGALDVMPEVRKCLKGKRWKKLRVKMSEVRDSGGWEQRGEVAQSKPSAHLKAVTN